MNFVYGEDYLSLNMFSEYVVKADNHIKKAQEQASRAEIAENSEKIEDAANQRFLAGKEYFLAAVDFETILRILEHMIRVSATDEEFLDYKSKLIDAFENSCRCYEKAAQLFRSSGNRFAESGAYGLAASNYVKLAELKNSRAIRREVKKGVVITYVMDTPFGKAITAYHSAASALYDIGIKYRNSGEIDKAYVIIGDMGDAYLSIGFLCERENVDLAIENFFSAAEAYKESGLMARKVGIPTIVFHARMEWHYAIREVMEFFKDERGYSTSDDIRRAIMVYGKTKELAKKARNKNMIYECSKAILSLSTVTKEPQTSIKSCQEICESMSEFVILPIDLSTKQLSAADKEVIRSTLKKIAEEPKQGAYQLISHLELRLRDYIKAKLSSINPTNWFQESVIPVLDRNDLNTINSNYRRETGKSPEDLPNEGNPLSFANISHLPKIVYNEQNWITCFQDDFVNLEEFNANMSIIVRIRHPTMHVRQTGIFEAAVTPVIWMLERLRPS